MENQIQLLLNSEKNIESVNQDINTMIELNTAYSEITEYKMNNAVNASIVFESERQNTPIYRIYGRIEYTALLNRLKLNYSEFQDFFLPQSGSCKTLLNSFKFWLVRPSSLYKATTTNGKVKRYFDIIAEPESIEIFTAGFGKNIFGEQIYAFNLNVDIDISDYYDIYGFPITELFLYAQYLPTTSPLESLYATEWSYTGGIPSKKKITSINGGIDNAMKYDNSTYIIDLIEYNEDNYTQVLSEEQVHYIHTPIYQTSLVTSEGTATFSYDVTAHAYIVNTSSGGSATSDMTVRYSTDSGNTWTNVDNAHAYASGYHHDDDMVQITGTFTITTMLHQFNDVRVIIHTNYYSTGSGTATGGGYIKIDSIVMGDNSTTNILCNNTYTIYGTTPQLNCDITPPLSNPAIQDIRFSAIGSDKSAVMIAENYAVTNDDEIIWKYNPLIPLKLRYLANELNEVNTGSTYYTTLNTIPAHATDIGDGNYVWRNILPEGYSDPLTGDGNDVPFINKRRYFFEAITLNISPDMDDTYTYDKFNEMEYTKNSTEINIKPIDTGTPCH